MWVEENRKKIEEMSGFRVPNEYEKKAVSHYFQKLFIMYHRWVDT